MDFAFVWFRRKQRKKKKKNRKCGARDKLTIISFRQYIWYRYQTQMSQFLFWFLAEKMDVKALDMFCLNDEKIKKR